MRKALWVVVLFPILGCRSIAAPVSHVSFTRPATSTSDATPTLESPETANPKLGGPYDIRVVGRTLEFRYREDYTNPELRNQIYIVFFDRVPSITYFYNLVRYPELLARYITVTHDVAGDHVDVWDHDPVERWRYSVRLGGGDVHRKADGWLTVRVPMSLISESPQPVMGLKLFEPFSIELLQNGRRIALPL